MGEKVPKQQLNRPSWAYDSGFRPNLTVVAAEVCALVAKELRITRNKAADLLIRAHAGPDAVETARRVALEDDDYKILREKWR